MRSQFGSIPSLIHELTSLVLLVSFMARWDAAHGQHYGSTFWKSGVGWNKEVPRQRVCRRGNHQQWAWVIINSEWLVGKLFSFAVIMHLGCRNLVFNMSMFQWKKTHAMRPYILVCIFSELNCVGHCPGELTLSHFLIWALWKCRKFMQGFDFLIKLLSL